LWPLAIIVFTASVVVPLVKLFGLSLMLVMTGLRSRRWLVGRTRLFRFIDRIGRWSNIDVFMISILVALVQFGALTSVRPEPGAIAFAAVVIVTMIASRSFDARVMWDAGRAA
jgi:paraquat-inducible protein A